jgi:hypothetical protein
MHQQMKDATALRLNDTLGDPTDIAKAKSSRRAKA